MLTFDELISIKQDIWNYLKSTNKPIIMYGTGNGADKIINVFEGKGIKLCGIFASDDFARGQNFRGFTVKKYSDFCDEYRDFIVVVSFASQRPEVLGNIYRIADERELYAPDVPVFGDGLFDHKYFMENYERLKSVFERLADDISKKVFINSIAFKLTGNIRYLRECETDENETDNLLRKIVASKNYIDIGAYTGDTVEKYTLLFGKEMNLYAFEPDEKNYKKMQDRFREKGIECNCFNAAAWNRNEILKFNARSGRAGTAVLSVTNEKIKEICALRPDSVIQDDIGFIKIDAEGSDTSVICGLEGIIRKNKPSMKIAAYHRNEDFFAIPETVSSICNSYSLYMRHLSYVPGWDTDFFFEFSE